MWSREGKQWERNGREDLACDTSTSTSPHTHKSPMGVPAFFRWVREKYSKVLVPVVEESLPSDGDWSGPNPNSMEFDNLYLDMNGIIHPCARPEDGPAPETEDDMFQAITAYIDRIVCAVRPRKLLYMAIDGVAPRAKMNQQRARRFKSAAELAERAAVESEIRGKLLHRGGEGLVLPPKPARMPFDSNVITPGTRFMARLAAHLRYYVHVRQATHPAWRTLPVILSDASVPGEGEHKIMEFVRQQRAQPGYHPGVRHILHGLDADLIMLGLATHEAYFTVLREEVDPPKGRGGGGQTCFKCGQEGHRADACEGKAAPRPRHEGGTERSPLSRKPLQFLHIAVLREYLDLEFTDVLTSYGEGQQLVSRLPFPYDIERLIDDFVFLCFFVGNDFLPHLPSMDIREGAIDLLIQLYTGLLPTMGGYMTHNGNVNLARVDHLLRHLGGVEEEIFRRQRRKEERERTQEAGRKAEAERKKITPRMAAILELISGSGKGVKGDKHKQQQQVAVAAAATAASVGAGGVEAASNKKAKIGGGGGEEGGALESVPAPSTITLPTTTMTSIPGLGGVFLPTAPPAATTAAAPSTTNKMAASSMRAALLGGGGGGGGGAAAASAASEVGKKRSLEEEGGGGRGEGEALASSAAEVGTSSELVGGGGASEEVLSPLVLERFATVISAATYRGEMGGEEDEEYGGGEGGSSSSAAGAGAGAGSAPPPPGFTPGELAAGILSDALDLAMVARATHDEVVDTVQLGVVGWRERYYSSKFGGPSGAEGGFVRKVCQAYVEGLVWVFRYYYQGVASWKWFYPYHYAPFASDLQNLSSYSVTFELGRPFRPMDQLMGVLPSLSSAALPAAAAALMTSASSPIRDFYPLEFKQDPNGKRMSWQWVVLLPFVDEGALVAAMDSVIHTFTPEELARNELGNDVLLCHAERCGMGKVIAPLALTQAACDLLLLGGGGGGEGGLSSSPRATLIERTRARVMAEEKAVIVNITEGYEGGDATVVHTPTISPAVTEAFALVEAMRGEEKEEEEGGGGGGGGGGGEAVTGGTLVSVISMLPGDGDREGKGFTAFLLPYICGAKYGYAAPLGGTFLPPPLLPEAASLFPRPPLPSIPNNQTVVVSFLPPTRKAHLCVRATGATAFRPHKFLSREDSPAGIVPKLSRGISVADLVGRALSGGGGGGGGSGSGSGGGGGGGGGEYHHHSASFAHASQFQSRQMDRDNGPMGRADFVSASASAAGGGGGGGGYAPQNRGGGGGQHPLLAFSSRGGGGGGGGGGGYQAAAAPSFLPFLPPGLPPLQQPHYQQQQQQYQFQYPPPPLAFMPPGLPYYPPPPQQQQQQQQPFHFGQQQYPQQQQWQQAQQQPQQQQQQHFLPGGMTPQQAAVLASMGLGVQQPSAPFSFRR